MITKEQVVTPEQLTKAYEDYKVGKAKSFSGPSQNNRCSVLGHPCTAYCYYDRTVDPVHRIEISSHLASIFAEGNDQERIFQRDLLEMGFDVSQQQGSLAWPQYKITGHRDFKISHAGSPSVRCEFKSVHPLLWVQLNTPDDIKNHRSFFIQKWAAQVVLYMLLDSQTEYWLIMKNKSTGQIKVVVFEWNGENADYAENYIKKAETVNALVEKKNMPDSMKLADVDICNGCEFLTICNPPLDFGKGVDIIDEETAAELAELAETRAKNEEAATAFDEADEELKGRIKALAGSEKAQMVFGDWSAEIKRQNVKEEKAPRKAFVKTIVKFQKLVKEVA